MHKFTGLLLVVIFFGDVKGSTLENNGGGSSNSEHNVDVNPISAKDIDTRLPHEVRPLHYDLYLHPDLKNGTFKGRVSVLINLLDARKYLILNQQDLNIDFVNLYKFGETNESSEEIKINRFYSISEKQVFIVVPELELSIGQYDLKLSFSGSLSNSGNGFYSSTYKDELNNTRTLATTQFEATNARKAFPCFDEPSFKAEFSIKLVYPSSENYTALSNMNCEKLLPDDPAPGLTTAVFAKSVPMSTYLACFIVSDFVAVSKTANVSENKTIPVSVYTTRAQKEKGAFVAVVGVKMIEYYSKLFKIDYPLPKLDMAAIPDFLGEAMENWGLVTYKETEILYDNTTSNSHKLTQVQIVAHELAHMWFGNLVTMKWWNDLWLNEAFATYMQFKSSSEVIPEWNFMDHFLLDVVHVAFVTDAKLSSHPIVQTVNHPDEISSLFDDISYEKGASVIRMLEKSIGTNNFNEGLTKYLKKFAYGNAETDDLLDSLQHEVGDKTNVKEFMNTWTKQMGFPVINVKKLNFTNYFLTQKRFLENPGAKYKREDSPYSYRWTIPVTYITSKNSTPTLVWFDKDTENLTLEINEPVDWIKFNCDQIGYYRVNYEKPEWKSLMHVLKSNYEIFSSQDRTHLLEEVFSLAKAGELDYDIPMNMTLYLLKEKHFAPWFVVTSKFKSLNLLLASSPTSDKFQDFARELVDPIYHYVFWKVDKEDSQNKLSLRSRVLDLACAVGHKKCLEEVGSIFKTWINDNEDVRPHPDFRGLVYYYGMKHAGGEKEWKVMFDRFMKEKNAAEKLKLMKGLAGIQSHSILKKYINYALDKNYMRPQNALKCLISISRNPVGRNLTWDWVRENWTTLVDHYTINSRLLGELIPSITKSFSTEEKLYEMKEFFEKYPQAGAGAMYRAQALETVESNVKWLEKNLLKIDSWFDMNKKRNNSDK